MLLTDDVNNATLPIANCNRELQPTLRTVSRQARSLVQLDTEAFRAPLISSLGAAEQRNRSHRSPWCPFRP
eukprot:scaffold81478_cov59-Cyclotella_meneghiniana.AAC.4